MIKVKTTIKVSVTGSLSSSIFLRLEGGKSETKINQRLFKKERLWRCVWWDRYRFYQLSLYVIFQLRQSLCMRVSVVCWDVYDGAFTFPSEYRTGGFCRSSTPCPLPHPVTAAGLWNTKIASGPVCSSWCPLCLIRLVTTHQSVSLEKGAIS